MRRSDTAAIRGKLAEDAVADWLCRTGCAILARNYAVPGLGELDLVVWQDHCLTIIEVKARSQADQFGGPAAALTPAKLRRVRRTATYFQQSHHYLNHDIRLLAALVELDSKGNVLSIETVPVEWQ